MQSRAVICRDISYAHVGTYDSASFNDIGLCNNKLAILAGGTYYGDTSDRDQKESDAFAGVSRAYPLQIPHGSRLTLHRVQVSERADTAAALRRGSG